MKVVLFKCYLLGNNPFSLGSYEMVKLFVATGEPLK